MNARSNLFRGLAVALIALGGIAALLNLLFLPGPRVALAVAVDVAFVALGALMLRRHRQALAAPGSEAVASRQLAAPSLADDVRPRVPFGLVLVLCDESARTPLYEQAHGMLLRKIAATPTYPLAPDAEIVDVWAPSLPPEDPTALVPVVRTMQDRFKRRGGAWQADFHDPLGQEFVVLYLE